MARTRFEFFLFFQSFFGHRSKRFWNERKNVSHFGQNVWKYGLKNTVTVSFYTTARQMTEMFRWPKCISKTWPKCFSEKKAVLKKLEKNYLQGSGILHWRKAWRINPDSEILKRENYGSRAMYGSLGLSSCPNNYCREISKTQLRRLLAAQWTQHDAGVPYDASLSNAFVVFQCIIHLTSYQQTYPVSELTSICRSFVWTSALHLFDTVLAALSNCES